MADNVATALAEDVRPLCAVLHLGLTVALLLVYLSLLVALVFILFPLFCMFLSSFK